MARSERNRLIGRLHQLKAQAGLDDETYRARLALLSGGKRSASDLTDSELSDVVQKFPVKQSAVHPHTRMVRAMWISCFHLGVVENGTDKALDAFVLHQTGKHALSFLAPVDANKVTEALKAMAARSGFIVPAEDKGGMRARQALLRAQWKLLAERGVVQNVTPWSLDEHLKKTTGAATIYALDARGLDTAARAFGELIRKTRA